MALCVGGGQPLIQLHIYIHAENCPEKVLKWSDRLRILIGVAKAVHFLHTGVIPGCFNNRLKTNNILLDEHQVAKLSDYGMSIISGEIEKSEVVILTHITLLFQALECAILSWAVILTHSVCSVGKGRRPEIMV